MTVITWRPRAGSYRRHASRLLSEAPQALKCRNSGGDPGWVTCCDEAELAAEAAHCFRDVDHARRAVAHAENAMSGTHVRSDFFATMVLADAHLRAGDVEEACRVALDALDLGEQLKSARCVSYLAEFRQRPAGVAPSAVVRDLHEQAADHRMLRPARGDNGCYRLHCRQGLSPCASASSSGISTFPAKVSGLPFSAGQSGSVW